MANWGVYYTAVIQQVLDGKWKNDPVWWGMAQKAVALDDLNTSVLPANALKDVATRRDQIASGKWDVFTGPIRDQAGGEKVPAGKTLSDRDLQRINWYVDGVDGSLPK